ncbi:hypothetical protein RP29_17835 [Acidovorax temperans]|uniref:Uncharacterized protein n=1 Tax=Acidovorax temperans TaxID=80878 RepID=A0A0D7K5I6_9BURK|nr:hypothetical protein RP29_17835 [Acidovorax temperans]
MNPQQAVVDTDTALSDKTVADLLEKVDLQPLVADKTLSIHKRSELAIDQPEFRLQIQVFDLAYVYITAKAKAALRRCYLTPAFLLDKFGAHYAQTLLTVGTRGKLKGVTYLNPDANVYRHDTDNGLEIIVSGVSGEREGKTVREVHITCGPRTTQSELTSSAEVAPSL